MGVSVAFDTSDVICPVWVYTPPFQGHTPFYAEIDFGADFFHIQNY